jgi:hypothetical protein
MLVASGKPFAYPETDWGNLRRSNLGANLIP